MFKSICVPSGIGDLSWMYSKLCHVQPMKWLVSEGWPARSVPYLKLLPKVAESDYAPFNYSDIVKFEEASMIPMTPSWEMLKTYQGNNIFLEANRHLEAGKPLAEWLPDLPTDYHYQINIPDEEVRRARKLIQDLERPIWGISAASYRGAEAWETWGVSKWLQFLSVWREFAGGTILLLGGHWDDLTFALSSEAGYHDLVGKTSVPMALAIMRDIEGYIGFSSGLGIVRTVFNKPTMMMWPKHQVELSLSWADPEMVESKVYVASQWLDPIDDVFPIAKAWHRRNFQGGRAG